MKRYILIFNFAIMPFALSAYDGTISQSGSCGATDADCHYDLYEDGHLEISGTGEMSDFNYSKGNAAPWGPASSKGESLVKTVNIDGITKIGTWAFLWSRELTDVKISDTVKIISGGAFEYTGKLESLVIPSSVERMGEYNFSNSGIKNLVIEGTPELTHPDSTFIFIDKYSDGTFHEAKIYCLSNFNCADKGQGENATVVPYDIQGGVYILDDKYYLSGTDMTGGTNICKKELNECKRDVLQNKGICQGSSCDMFIQSDGQYMLKYNGKTYQDINALLKGNYDRRRIYTIEEANFVAGKVNTVKIKYK